VEDKHNAFAACTILCNPSYFESFSLVIMEGWLAKKPILVSEHCAVTTEFARETNGGLWYQNYAEFQGCVSYLLQNRDVCDTMGQNGFRYVMEHFTHEKIAQNYLKFIEICGL
jgi:glycosyltransferase involved in cell wall biosynthesis